MHCFKADLLCRGLLQVISSYGEKKMFYVAKFHPEQQNVMLAGCGDKKIYQWDMDSGDLVQVGTAKVHSGAETTFMQQHWVPTLATWLSSAWTQWCTQ